MAPYLPRLIFAVLCVLSALAIVVVALLEIGRARRGESLLAPWHLRLRLITALIWIIALISLAIAVTTQWPPPYPTKNQQLQFVALVNGVVMLVALGLLLAGGDYWVFWRKRRRIEQAQTLRFAEELRAMAESETARLRAEQRPQSNGASRDSSHD